MDYRRSLLIVGMMTAVCTVISGAVADEKIVLEKVPYVLQLARLD